MRTRKRRRREREEEEEVDERPVATATTTADRVLDLQRTAGNRATRSAVARWGLAWLPLAGAPAWPKEAEARFDGDLVVPVASVSEAQGQSVVGGGAGGGKVQIPEMYLTVRSGDHTAELFLASAEGRRFKTVEIILPKAGQGGRYILTDVLVDRVQHAGELDLLTLSFGKRELSMSPPPRR